MSGGHGSFSECDDRTTSDGLGSVLHGIRNTFDYGYMNWEVLSPEGRFLKLFGRGPAGQELPFALESGFQWFVAGESCSYGGECTSSAAIRAYSHEGELQSSNELYRFGPYTSVRPSETSWSAASDPGKGLLVTHLHREHGTWTILARRFDSAGAPLGPDAPVSSGAGSEPTTIPSAVDPSSVALVLWDAGGTFSGRWMYASGTPASPIFQTDIAVPIYARVSLHRFLDDSLALQVDGAWTARFARASTSPQAVPKWLAARPGTTLEIVRGGKAYALFLPLTTCTPVRADLFSASGKLCGALDLPIAAGCALAGDSGRDGTVILGGVELKTGKCTRSYWPGLLR